MARAHGARAQMALAFETVYGTAPATGYRTVPFASTTLGSEQPLIASELLGQGRDPLAPIKDAVTADGDVVVPIDVENLGLWLKAAFGAPVTSGTTPKTHTFQSGNWTLPSMAIETAMPEVPRYAMYTGCVCDQLSWQMARSGLLTATARLVAQGESVAAATAAGTPTSLALQRFGHFNGAITRNGSPLGNVISAEVTYSNGLDRIETIRSDGRIDGADPGMAALTGRVEVRFADSTLITQAIDGTPCELVFAWSLGANASFTFTAHAVYLPRPKIEIPGPRYPGHLRLAGCQGRQNAVGEFVKTGKLDFRDLVTSMIADLAKLAARRFILGPIANALSGAISGAGGLFANILHAGGMVGSPGPARMVPAMAFANAPRMHAGGWAGIKPDEVPAILQKGERGVDAFLIGTEMPGLTTIRSSASTYPAVTAFRTLAADVSTILGAGTKIGYAADWSEYFGHRPQDGSSDVYFHLDPLWSDANIDFVGIDNYLPLSDWRDGFDHADALEGWPAIYDRAYLQANIAGGEGFDWFYASAADRSAQVRMPINDGAAGKPWVFRPKDICAWWQSQHFNRPGGVEIGTPTAWVPQSKPIRFTELGCPAIDRGTNQPNVFFDPKSSESFTPYFSRGGRDDAIQRAYLEASYLHWGDPANNPISAVYGGRMVHVPECAAWTWDARPYPFFPELTDVWTDGPNWRLGHWLTGRLGAVSLAALVRHLCLRAGMPECRKP